MDNTNLKKQLEELKKEIEALKQRRISQQMIIPDAIKMRGMGEANRFVRCGLAADRPTIGETSTDSTALYFATDTGLLSIWNGSAWLETTLS